MWKSNGRKAGSWVITSEETSKVKRLLRHQAQAYAGPRNSIRVTDLRSKRDCAKAAAAFSHSERVTYLRDLSSRKVVYHQQNHGAEFLGSVFMLGISDNALADPLTEGKRH